MTCEIICVGTELLLGDIVNTNAAYLSAKLSEIGINVYNQSVVGDNPARLFSAIENAKKKCDLIILSGGLGPTLDDITKETVADVCGLRLIENADVKNNIENYFVRMGRATPAGVQKQALIIEGATILKNNHGTAPGLVIDNGGCKFILLPGPPNELQPMFEQEVKPILLELSDHIILSHNLYIYGIGESEVANKIGIDLLNGANPTVATYAKSGEVLVRITASANNNEEAEKIICDTENAIRNIFGDAIYSTKEGGLQATVVELLMEKGLKVATAESCTAGLLSKKITEVSGSSKVFDMGISAYANEIKMRVLKVPEEIIKTYGAVSYQTATLMAKGVLQTALSDIGISITGVAGPESSESKPVGLVYVALTDGDKVWVRELNAAYNNDRERVRNSAILAALDLIRRYLLSLPNNMLGGQPIEQPVPLKDPFLFEIPKEVITESEQDTLEEDDEFLSFLKDEDDDLLNFLVNEEPKAKPTELFKETKNTDFFAQPEEEKSVKPFIKFLKRILPWHKDPLKEIIRKTVFIIALLVFVGTGIYLLKYYNQGNVNQSLLDEARSIYSTGDNNIENGMNTKFDELKRQNSDVCGWISIDGTKIDYPVYQAKDNDFYVNHDMSRKESRYGAIFADYTATIKKNSRSQNVVLYGHNMIDGSMFSGLLEYKNLDFYKTNPLINFDTLYSNDTYKVFAVMVTNVKKDDDDGFIFNYMLNSFNGKQNFLYWIANVRARSIINTDVDILADDQILTLSTCSYEFDDARTVIFARKVREGESLHVNVDKAEKNSNVLYPQAYYKKNGGKKPDVEIDFSMPSITEDTLSNQPNLNFGTQSSNTATSSKENENNESDLSIPAEIKNELSSYSSDIDEE